MLYLADKNPIKSDKFLVDTVSSFEFTRKYSVTTARNPTTSGVV
jgi:hypothetical protein